MGSGAVQGETKRFLREDGSFAVPSPFDGAKILWYSEKPIF